MTMPLPQCRMPDSTPRALRFRLPPASVDAHIHIFGDTTKYPPAAARLFEPPAVAGTDYLKLSKTVGIERAVIVHSAVYGSDHKVSLDLMTTAPARYRGIAVLHEQITDKELQDLAERGFCGFRVNLVSGRGLSLDAARRMADRVRPLGWHVQVLMDVELMPDLNRIFAAFPIDIVVDHMGRPDPGRGWSGPGFQALLNFLRSGRGWTKISAPYRTSQEPPDYADMKPFAQMLASEAPDRIVWGSDWPHVMVEGPMPNDGDLLNQIGDWIADEKLRQKLFVDNPRLLYGFAD